MLALKRPTCIIVFVVVCLQLKKTRIKFISYTVVDLSVYASNHLGFAAENYFLNIVEAEKLHNLGNTPFVFVDGDAFCL